MERDYPQMPPRYLRLQARPLPAWLIPPAAWMISDCRDDIPALMWPWATF